MKVKERERFVSGRPVSEWKKRIHEVLIKSHRYRDIDYSASKLAAEFGLASGDLSRLMYAATGTNYTTYVNKCRIEDAKKMLTSVKHKHYAVDEIGLLAGFRNRQSFFTSFSKYTGTTPHKYREENTK